MGGTYVCPMVHTFVSAHCKELMCAPISQTKPTYSIRRHYPGVSVYPYIAWLFRAWRYGVNRYGIRIHVIIDMRGCFRLATADLSAIANRPHP